jgi:hypothetical protein
LLTFNVFILDSCNVAIVDNCNVHC